jgi:phospholipase/lecithinase/hemolysin
MTNTGCAFLVLVPTTPMAVSQMASTLYPLRNNTSVCGSSKLADSIPSKPEVKNSLDGGTNYAYGFATTGTGTGTFTFGPSDSLSVDVENIGQQITDYLATRPKITKKTLFVVWGGANDLIYATSANDIIDAGINQTLNIQRLIAAGATQFIVPNLPPLRLIPRLNGNVAASAAATVASTYYNMVLSNGIQALRDSYAGKHLQIVQLHIFGLFNQIVASPSDFSLANVTASSQGVPSVDPDAYLFWDDLHPTTHGHNVVAVYPKQLPKRSRQRERFGWCRNARWRR